MTRNMPADSVQIRQARYLCCNINLTRRFIIMEFIKILTTSIGSAAALFIITKLIGSKQMSQLNMFDYINGITIGSIAAELATTSEPDFWQPLTALVIYGLAAFMISLISSKSIKCRRFLEGKSILLMQNGKLFPDNFKKAKLDMNEFLTICRTMGYFDLSQLYAAIFEPNGRISLMPSENYRPVTPNDLNVTLSQTPVQKSVIIDGKILEENLRLTGHDENFLRARLKEKNLSVSDVYYGSGDTDGNFCFYEYEIDKHPNDPFQ